MKKILFISGPLNAGGAEKVFIDVLNNLDYNKYQIDLLLIINKGILIDQIPKEVNIIPIWEDYTLNFKIGFRLSKYFNINYLLKRKITSIITEEYDVILSVLEGLPLKIHSLIKKSTKNLTWVHTDLLLHNYTKQLFYKSQDEIVYSKMDKIICVSQDCKNQFDLQFKTLNNKSVVLYNPIVLEKILLCADKTIRSNNKDLFNIILVGRLVGVKRIDRAIEVLKLLRNDKFNVSLTIVGDGELRSDLEKLVKNNKLESVVNFIGYTNNPYPYIKNADVLLSTSDFEGFGLVLVEAMVLGVPVISTKTAGPREIIDQDKYGLLTDFDSNSIYTSIKRLIENKDLRNHYSEIGKERAKDFDVSKTMESFDKLINEITS